jgi:hypothetical protein
MNDKINRIIDRVLAKADENERNAGYGGLQHDNGASQMREQVHFYNMGAAGVLPEEWKKFEKELDPEYKEYERLKKKFG